MMYAPEIPAERYIQAMTAYYNAGLREGNMAAVYDKVGDVVTAPQASAAYLAGQMDAGTKDAQQYGLEPFQKAANEVLKKSVQKHGTGLTMSANDGILNKKDVYAIDQYKKSIVAYQLNAALRSGLPLTDKQKAITHDLDQALLKLPIYQGTVYRSLTSSMMEDVQGFWDRYKPGEFVSELSYVSSSTEVYDETMDIQMVITSKRGCDMRAYNVLEQEILFRRGTLFFVEKREGNTIWLTEV